MSSYPNPPCDPHFLSILFNRRRKSEFPLTHVLWCALLYYLTGCVGMWTQTCLPHARGQRKTSSIAPLLQTLWLSFLLCMPGWLVWEHPGILLSLPPVSCQQCWDHRWWHYPHDLYIGYEDSNLDPLAYPESIFPRWATSPAQFISDQEQEG